MVALSGILYTLERFLAVFKWVGEVAPVKINGSGSYPKEPTMPGLFDNFFVGFFLFFGLIWIMIGIIRGNRERRETRS